MTATVSRARLAYETLEPFHVLAYFNPGLPSASAETGLDMHALYVGGRGGPLGDCHHAVVTAAFYNFSPTLVETAWTSARAYGLSRLGEVRDRMLDEQLRTILADRVDDAALSDAADTLLGVVAALPRSGRPLGAAWAAAAVPDQPHLRLWYATAALREWRGDNHIATLVTAGLDGFDAAVFHEAALPDPTVRRRVLGKDMTVLTRGWSVDDWEAAVDRLAARGLVERTDAGHRLTALGAARYDDIEATTDALGEAVWAQPGLVDTLTALRPYVKAVIDAGVLPGTRKNRSEA
ncbi:MAG: hypothetical protein QM662_03140 [Gordonia sp. (in: high G+C Gram-positive bacteria)]